MKRAEIGDTEQLTPPPTSSMSDEHKAALAEGRVQGAAVRAYLEALELHRPKRGRKRTPDSIKKKLAAIEAEIDAASGVQKLDMMQTRRDLQTELESLEAGIDLTELEERFVEVAAAYGERKGIEYATWREFGVPAAVLKSAGIGRGS